MLIQILLIVFAIFVLIKISLKFQQKKIRLREFLLWLIFWLAVIVVVILPNITSYLANLVGIGRGSDLAVYLAVLGLFYLVFRIYVKMDNMDAQITKIVRSDAIDKSEIKNQKSE